MSEAQAIQLAQEPQEEVACPLCGKDVPELVMYARDRLFGRPGYYKIVRCTACDLRYLSPRPTLQSLGIHYPDDYFIYKQPEQENALIRPFSNWFDRQHWRASIARIERELGPFTPETRVVDVGCGLNHLLYHLKQLRGTVGIGVDFKPEVAAYVRDVRKMPVVQGTLHDGHFKDGEFDLVTMNEYLEHEPDPRGVLREARRITKKGGHVWVEVPLSDSLPSRIFKSRWSQVDAPRHLVHFTRETLTKMLESSGFKVVRIESFQIPLLIGMSALQSLGATRVGSIGLLDSVLVTALALPFSLVYPWMDEFMYAVARAE
jgi:ubiquinone/menaquinone biosynthesis C-methylase UbiE